MHTFTTDQSRHKPPPVEEFGRVERAYWWQLVSSLGSRMGWSIGKGKFGPNLNLGGKIGGMIKPGTRSRTIEKQIGSQEIARGLRPSYGRKKKREF